jgi:hypothetical protein
MGGFFASESSGIMAHSEFGMSAYTCKPIKTYLVVITAQALDHQVRGPLPFVTAPCALAQIGTLKFVAFGAAILTNFGARRAGVRHDWTPLNRER